jgi:hypothetical protein
MLHFLAEQPSVIITHFVVVCDLALSVCVRTVQQECHA